MAEGVDVARTYMQRGPDRGVERMLFGLSTHGEVYFRSLEANASWVQLAGPPCGLVWGTPIDIDATSTGIWVVCQKEFMTPAGSRREHFLFAKWAWSPSNNHAWWHMVASSNITQLDAVSDAVVGVDGSGTLLWRPAINSGKHSRWDRVAGPANVVLHEIAADSDEQGIWLWGLDDAGQLWQRIPTSPDTELPDAVEASQWTAVDPEGNAFWSEKGAEISTMKSSDGWTWVIDSLGRLLSRPNNGSCYMPRGNANENNAIRCWKLVKAPRFTDISDTASHGLGVDFPTLWRRGGEADSWDANPNRWVTHLALEDEGHVATSPTEEAAYYSSICSRRALQSPYDACAKLNASVEAMMKSWRRLTESAWSTWEWSALKQQYLKCSGSRKECQRPLKLFGSFRKEYMEHVFCCSRSLLAPDDPDCTTPDCRAYDMTCPGSRLLTSDLDCTVYHSRDPGALMLQMRSLASGSFSHLVRDPLTATLHHVFDASLYGTWTWIPNAIFQRFEWPASSKALFDHVEDTEQGLSVWVLRRKCTTDVLRSVVAGFRQAVEGPIGQQQREDTAQDAEQMLAEKLRAYIGGFADGRYHDDNSERGWDSIFRAFHAVAELQSESYLSYPTTLEIVGRQQAGIPLKFHGDKQCLRAVSFVEQLVFVATNIKDDLTDALSMHEFQEQAIGFLVHSGKYFDRLLELHVEDADLDASAKGSTSETGGSDSLPRIGEVVSVLFDVLEALHGRTLSGPAPTCASCRWAQRWLHSNLQEITNEEVRRRSCMDIAMWGNAVRHTEALRETAAGGLLQPLAQAFFTCFVPPEAQAAGAQLKAAILQTLQEWVDAVEELDRSSQAAAARWASIKELALTFCIAGAAAAAGLAAFGERRKIRRRNSTAW